jgi:hypothetical protein
VKSDQDIVRAMRAILRARPREVLRDLLFPLGAAKGLTQIVGSDTVVASMLQAVNDELAELPDHEEEALLDAVRFGKEVDHILEQIAHARKVGRFVHAAVEAIGPEKTKDLLKALGGGVEVVGGANCGDCDDEECPAHPSSETADKVVH